MSNEQLIHDLTLLYLQKNSDINISPKEMFEKYNEFYKIFEDIVENQPVETATFLDKRKLF